MAQPPILTPASLIPTPSEGSEFSFFLGDHSSDSEGNEDDYEEVQSRSVNAADRSYQNVEPHLENNEPGFEEENSSLETIDRVSLVPSEEMNDQVSQLCDAVKTALNSQSAAYAKKLSVVIPVFRGEECEDVQEFISNYKRAARLNGWSESNLALGLPLYLKGHASAWFKTLENPDEMSFEEISAALIRHFASGASEWRVRQALGQRRQLESESVADYSYSLRTHCARLNFPRTEWTHYFVQGLRPGIREYVGLQKPDTLEAAENFAKLKESVLSTCDKTPTIDVKQVSPKILEEISKSVVPKKKTVSLTVPSVVISCDAGNEKVPKIRVIFKQIEIEFQQEKYKINVIQTICSSYFWFCGWKLKQKKTFKEKPQNLQRQKSETMVLISILHVPSVVVTCGAKNEKEIYVSLEENCNQLTTPDKSVRKLSTLVPPLRLPLFNVEL